MCPAVKILILRNVEMSRYGDIDTSMCGHEQRDIEYVHKSSFRRLGYLDMFKCYNVEMTTCRDADKLRCGDVDSMLICR